MDSISFNTSTYNSFHNNMHRKRLLLSCYGFELPIFETLLKVSRHRTSVILQMARSNIL